MKMFAQATDTQLINVFQNGNINALEVLVHRYKDKIYTSIFFLVKDKYVAEDLFQEVFIKIIDTLRSDRYNEEGKFLHWALRIAHNLCVDYFRKIKRTHFVASNERDVFELIGSVGDAADTKMLQSQSYQKIRGMLDYLPEEQREIIVLRHFAGMSFKEIADVTNCSINTSLGRMRYALINLRKMVAEKQIAL
ncbi:MAG: sigma-70 family RNA polymerase sigma factor [Flavobacterium sp.]|nr:sigma-70 family RNA polymerase sigma factor [Flavobacterium sp.]